MRTRGLWCKQGVRTREPYGIGKPHKDPSTEDYLLRYQVGLTLIGCSAESAQPQGQGFKKGQFPEGIASRREGGKRRFLCRDTLVVAGQLEPAYRVGKIYTLLGTSSVI